MSVSYFFEKCCVDVSMSCRVVSVSMLIRSKAVNGKKMDHIIQYQTLIWNFYKYSSINLAFGFYQKTPDQQSHLQHREIEIFCKKIFCYCRLLPKILNC